MNFHFNYLISTPPNEIIRILIEKLLTCLNDLYSICKIYFRDPRKTLKIVSSIGTISSAGTLNFSKIDTSQADYLSRMYCDHRFDLLGSGWVKNAYNSQAIGFEGHRYSMNLPINRLDGDAEWLKLVVRPSHLKKSQLLWKMIDNGYEPVDWQKDYKSGYRWNGKYWYKHQKYGNVIGADIKVPWELSRMQHLPQMAIFAMRLPDLKECLIMEFKNQVLDFIATNPPQMGVNWTSTMDVAIRAANILIALDIFRQIDSNHILQNDFYRVIDQSIYHHGQHIINNLEYSNKLTSNHYLSNICGLAFIAGYLECSPEIDCWLAFSIQELIAEVKKQFYPDGTNFEASTSYHRLSGEMVVYATSLVLGLSGTKSAALRIYNAKIWRIKEPKLNSPEKQLFNINKKELFPEWYMDRLFKSGSFTYHVTKPTGEIPQIGDNDSGRFFRLSPNGRFISNNEAESTYRNLKNYNAYLKSLSHSQQNNDLYWDENSIDHSTFLSALSGLFDNTDFAKSNNRFPLEYSFIRSLAHGFSHSAYIGTYKHSTKSNEIDIKAYPFHRREIYSAATTIATTLKQNLTLVQFPDAGIYIFKSDRLHLTISAGPNGQNGNGGHAHNDKLSFELNIDGMDIETDPGSYLYTSSPEMRNLFRSASVHNGPHIHGREPNFWRAGIGGLFNLENNVSCTIGLFHKNTFLAKIEYNAICHARRIEIQDFCIVVDDYSNVDFETTLKKPSPLYSGGYGKLIDRSSVLTDQHENSNLLFLEGFNF